MFIKEKRVNGLYLISPLRQHKARSLVPALNPTCLIRVETAYLSWYIRRLKIMLFISFLRYDHTDEITALDFHPREQI